MSGPHIIAHGLGGPLDLPVPIDYFVVGVVMLLLSHVVALKVLWTEPRLAPKRVVIWEPLVWPIRFLKAVGVGGLMLVLVSGAVAVAVSTETVGTRNIATVLALVYFWPAIPLLSVVFGNIYTALNPWMKLSGWLGIDGQRLTRYWGVWPAAIALLGFAWFWVVTTWSASPRSVAVFAFIYSGFMLAVMQLVGRKTAGQTFDAFGVYNRLAAGISPWRADGQRLVWRGWMRGLAGVRGPAGVDFFVSAMIGMVAFDGVFTGLDDAIGGLAAELWFRTVGFLFIVGACFGIYRATILATNSLGLRSVATRALSIDLAYTLVPLAVAFLAAHYFTLVIFEGQQIISSASDPLGLGWDLFGTRNYKINFFLTPTTIWYLQMTMITAGAGASLALTHEWMLRNRSSATSAVHLLILGWTVFGLYVVAG